MNLPKWSIFASIAVVVIAVVIIVIPGKKKQDSIEIVSADSNTVEVNEEQKTVDEKENNPIQSVINTDLEPESDVRESLKTSDTDDEEETEEAEPTEADEESVDSDELVKALSTEKNANAADFEWFMDMELYDGNESGRIITEPGRVERITGADNVLLNGGWKAYQLDTITDPYSPDVVRYFNVDIDTEGSKFNVTMNWAYLFLTDEGQSVTEEGNDLFEGEWDASEGTAAVQSKWAKVEFDNFFIASDHSAEYATGTFYWISGEIERIALMRIAE